MLEQNPLKISNSFTLTVISRASCNTIFLLITFRNDIVDSHFPWIDLGTPNQIRTGDTAVKGRGLNHLSMGAFGASGEIRTLDTRLKRAVPYHLATGAYKMYTQNR